MTSLLSSASFPPRSGRDVGESQSRWLWRWRWRAKKRSEPKVEMSSGRFPTGTWKYLQGHGVNPRTWKWLGNAFLPPETSEASDNQDGQKHPFPQPTCSSRTPVTNKCPGWGSAGSCAGLHGAASPGPRSWSCQPRGQAPAGIPPGQGSRQPASSAPSWTEQQWESAHGAPPKYREGSSEGDRPWGGAFTAWDHNGTHFVGQQEALDGSADDL